MESNAADLVVAKAIDMELSDARAEEGTRTSGFRQLILSQENSDIY